MFHGDTRWISTGQCFFCSVSTLCYQINISEFIYTQINLFISLNEKQNVWILFLIHIKMCRLIGRRQLSVFFSSCLLSSSLFILHGNFYFRWSKAKWRCSFVIHHWFFSELNEPYSICRQYYSSNAVFCMNSHGCCFFALFASPCVLFLAFFLVFSLQMFLCLENPFNWQYNEHFSILLLLPSDAIIIVVVVVGFVVRLA